MGKVATEPTSGFTPRVVGRYTIFTEIAAGGMATVCLGRLQGAVGFGRTVAIKRMHPHLAKDPDFVSMFVDEARVAGRIHHPNVVSTLDVVALEGELFVVLEYVQGESLSWLFRQTQALGEKVPHRIALRLAIDTLYGLHAAHEARDERGQPLGIVHRDVSPQNVLVGADGIARVIDFGVAKATGRLSTTREGQIKGKISYMSPEQLTAEEVDRRSDVYSAAVVLWEMLTTRRLFQASNDAAAMRRILDGVIERPSTVDATVQSALDAIVMRGLALRPDDRYATAQEMASELEALGGHASPREVAEWLTHLAGDRLATRARVVAEVESAASAGGKVRAPAVSKEAETLSVPITVAPDNPATGVNAVSTIPPRRRARRVGLWMVLGCAALFGGWLTLKRMPVVPAAIPTAVSSSQPSLPSVSASAAAPPASESAVASTVASALASSATPPKPAPARPRPHPAAPNCDPPFTVDSLGVRTYKRECVH